MKSKTPLQLFAAIMVPTSLSLAPLGLHAASGTWTGATDGTWQGANWSVSPAPGSVTLLNTADDATFNNNVNTTITIDANRNIDRINFETTAGAFTIGNAGANAGEALTLTSGSAIIYAANFSGAATAQTFNAPLRLQGNAVFQNLTGTAVGNTNILQFNGNISGGTAAAVTLTLNGNNVGASNVISSVISNGASSGLALSKTAGATWTLSGTNNSFTGGVSVSQGNLRVNTIAASGSNSSIGAGSTITLAGSTNPQTVFSIVGAGGTTNRALSISSNTTNHSSIDASGTGAAIFNGTFAHSGTAAPTLILTGTSASTIQNELNSNIANGSQAVSLTKTGSNIWRLGGTNSYTGNTTVNGIGGSLIVSGTGSTNTGGYTVTNGTLAGIGTNAFGNTSGIGIAAAGTLSLRGDSNTDFKRTSDSVLNSITTSASGATINVNQATVAGTGQTMTVGALGTSSVAATYLLNFSGANNTSLSVGAVTGPASTASTTVTISNAIAGGGSLNLASYTSANTAVGENLTFNGVGSTTVTGSITPSATALRLTQSGSGTTTLGGTNTYNGSTTVSAGRLTVSTSGTINNTSGVSIGAGEFQYNNSTTALSQGVSFSGSTGTLSGIGTITPAVIITSGNRQTAGTSVTSNSSTAILGTQTFSTSIDYRAGSIFEWNLTANGSNTVGLRGTDYDAVNTASLLNTGADAIFRVVLNGTENFDEAFWNADRTWSDIFKNGNTALNIETIFGPTVEYYNSAGLVANGNPTSGSFFISGTDLNWVAIPEPTTSAIAALLLSASLIRRRRA